MLSRFKELSIFKKMGKFFSFLPADIWSLMGLFVGLASAFSIYKGFYVEGAFILIISAILDEIDGSVARFKGTTKFGGILDSTSDRVVEGSVFAALTPTYPIAVVALIFSFLVSYVRARTECETDKVCNVGIGERAERLLILIAGLLFGWIEQALIIIVLLAATTAIWRVEYARKIVKASNSRKG